MEFTCLEDNEYGLASDLTPADEGGQKEKAKEQAGPSVGNSLKEQPTLTEELGKEHIGTRGLCVCEPLLTGPFSPLQ